MTTIPQKLNSALFWIWMGILTQVSVYAMILMEFAEVKERVAQCIGG